MNTTSFCRARRSASLGEDLTLSFWLDFFHFYSSSFVSLIRRISRSFPAFERFRNNNNNNNNNKEVVVYARHAVQTLSIVVVVVLLSLE